MIGRALGVDEKGTVTFARAARLLLRARTRTTGFRLRCRMPKLFLRGPSGAGDVAWSRDSAGYSRFEVVRIRRQKPGDALHSLIEDPWKALHCECDDDTCAALTHDVLYCVRTIHAPMGTKTSATGEQTNAPGRHRSTWFGDHRP